ncbi:MAG: hypothetical protein FWH41_06270 [Treponema sp.]|nr:hypothetical protein [Treponema sp.]
MKKFVIVYIFLAFLFNVNIFAQEIIDDNVPYLSEDDIEAVETIILEGDMLSESEESTDDFSHDKIHEGEMGCITIEEDFEIIDDETQEKAVQDIYHLLVLDRIYSPLYSDMRVASDISVLFRYLHGRDGYLIAVYKYSSGIQAYPELPEGSRVIIDFASVVPGALKQYIETSAFKRFVSSQTIISDLLELLTD